MSLSMVPRIPRLPRRRFHLESGLTGSRCDTVTWKRTQQLMPNPTDLANLDRCAHRVYLDVAGDPVEKLPASAFLELLWDSGLLHEDRIIATLGAVDVKVSD